ncbi:MULTISPECIES: amino acid ABC transporter ATP-binding protein [Aerococcus]|uniref:Amino acid ABC transporter ATP-binding protein n=1 Tax=Aerococcus sanguinicola TaxID=119206 RepID=A0A5N1GIL1_9LACT|nr:MULTISPECIES: amino acid ABC transporter ATP-binding protein [Aerococcus]KAA9300178.1 amino acid ABC transporter ATP-binding protein [Aerococcus sanguinicola]MDK6369520.1 amino acid ABC transporter ATP-binding protein [Aerococcus sp. UMB9870]MDK6680007.1 amino acid ABC transporter ATP-binding protein [Aerococcus sp. UMB8608]MDK6686111.1 amino acid ABC transporter ATP-binding protein [Aerococcus sp. UMB8623]MDK6939891.1 amino acid ABC transporter ATP-binding protein [Aerococcus sp. UMB8487]
MIHVNELSKSFADKTVLDNLSFDIQKGEVVGIIGPSGTGKSTLLRCLNRLERPDQGEIKFDDKAYSLTSQQTDEITDMRRHTAMVFQQFNLFKRKTAIENVAEALVTVQGLASDQAQAKAKTELHRVGLAGYENHYPHQLSGGQQQRVAIARAIALEPQLLLLDEPTSALDPELVGEVLSVIKEIAQAGYTMLLVSHEMAFVREVADRVFFLDQGQILEAGPADQVFDHPKSDRAKQFFSKVKERY